MGDLPAQQLLIRIQSLVNGLNDGFPGFTFLNIPVYPFLNKDLFEG